MPSHPVCLSLFQHWWIWWIKESLIPSIIEGSGPRAAGGLSILQVAKACPRSSRETEVEYLAWEKVSTRGSISLPAWLPSASLLQQVKEGKEQGRCFLKGEERRVPSPSTSDIAAPLLLSFFREPFVPMHRLCAAKQTLPCV